MHNFLLTLVNAALFLAICELYRRKSYRTKWKRELLGMMVVVCICEAAVLVNGFMELPSK